MATRRLDYPDSPLHPLSPPPAADADGVIRLLQRRPPSSPQPVDAAPFPPPVRLHGDSGAEEERLPVDADALDRELRRLEAIARRQAELMVALRNERSRLQVESAVAKVTRAAVADSPGQTILWRAGIVLAVTSFAATLAMSALAVVGVDARIGSIWSAGAFALGVVVGVAGSVCWHVRAE